MFGIFTSRAMREHGRYQIQCMKTRSSSGVGQKVDLEFDIDSLRIRDAPDDGNNNRKPQSSIMSQIKQTTTVRPAEPETGKIVADVNSSKLKQMLANIKSTS